MPDLTKAVFDSSPLIFLDTLGYIQSLEALYVISITPEVIMELQAKPNKPGSTIPNLTWINHQTPKSETTQSIRQSLAAGAGELSSLALASDLNCLVVLDDQRPKRFASYLNLKTVGTLGILLRLHTLKRNQRSITDDLTLLEAANMHLSAKLKQTILERLTNGK